VRKVDCIVYNIEKYKTEIIIVKLDRKEREKERSFRYFVWIREMLIDHLVDGDTGNVMP
jgi:hypothetical protein